MTLTEHFKPLLDKRLPAAFAVLLLSAVPAFAIDHLAPPIGIAQYEDQLAKTFKDVYADDIQLRAVVEPSFGREFAVGVRLSDGLYSIVYLQAKDSVWQSIVNKESGPLVTTRGVPMVRVEKCQHQIPSALAQRLSSIWDQMIRGIEPDDSVGLDGTSYYFSKIVDGEFKTGMAWSPEVMTKTGGLVGIVETMKQLCAAPRKSLLEQLNRESNDVLTRIVPEHPK